MMSMPIGGVLRPSTLMEPTRYKPLNYCLYCLCSEAAAKDLHPDGLTEEHIVPLALNGSLVVPKAVCRVCQTITGAPEQQALNSDFLVPRLLLELKRRRAKKKPPKKLPLVAAGQQMDAADLEVFNIELTVAQYPPIFQLLSLRSAGLLVGEDRPDGSLNEVRCTFCDLGVRSRVTVSSVTTRTPHQHTAFSYSLAKMAYAYAIAELGRGAFEGEALRSVLLGKRGDIYNFVGGLLIPETGTRAVLHRLSLRTRGDWTTVVVHLFASTGVAPYEVVVGRTVRQTQVV